MIHKTFPQNNSYFSKQSRSFHTVFAPPEISLASQWKEYVKLHVISELTTVICSLKRRSVSFSLVLSSEKLKNEYQLIKNVSRKKKIKVCLELIVARISVGQY